MTAGRKVNTDSHDWCTPHKYVESIREVFGGEIHLDPCSNPHSIVDAKVSYSLPDNDGLTDSWEYPTIYVNPPYGTDRDRKTSIKNWLGRCLYARRDHGSEVIALVPVATNTSHWKEYVWGGANAVCFLYDTRLKFLIDGKYEGTGAPMACSIIYWGEKTEKFMSVFSRHGAVVDLKYSQIPH